MTTVGPVPSTCGVCRAAVEPGEATVVCPACLCAHHEECWTENGGCSVYGCEHVPRTATRSALDVAPAYWGQENKPCPACGTEILAAALRCRNCGATFRSARPEDSLEYEARTAAATGDRALRRGVVWLFVFAVLPITMPVALLWGVPWWSIRRRRIATLPAIYSALARVGVGIAIGETAFLAVALLLYTLLRGA